MARVGLALLALAVLVWAREGLVGFAPFLHRFDHCQGIACDWREFYAPQAAALDQRRIVAGWTSPPLLAIFFRYVPAWPWVDGLLAVALVPLCLREVGSRSLAIALVALSMPVAHTLKWGQVSLLLAVPAIAAVYVPRARPYVAGVLGALKVYPLGWLADLAVRRELRALAVAAAVFLVAGMVVPALFLGAGGTLAFWQVVIGFQDPDALASAVVYGGQALPVTLARFGLSPWLALAVLAAGGWALVRCDDPVRGAAIAMCTVSLVLQPGWHHYYAFLPWVYAVGLARGVPAFAWVGIALCAAPLVALQDVPGAYATWTAWGGTTVAAVCGLGAVAGRAGRDVPV